MTRYHRPTCQLVRGKNATADSVAYDVHDNVVSTLDVTEHGDELVLVMDYVHGEPLSRLAKLLACGIA